MLDLFQNRYCIIFHDPWSEKCYRLSVSWAHLIWATLTWDINSQTPKKLQSQSFNLKWGVLKRPWGAISMEKPNHEMLFSSGNLLCPFFPTIEQANIYHAIVYKFNGCVRWGGYGRGVWLPRCPMDPNGMSVRYGNLREKTGFMWALYFSNFIYVKFQGNMQWKLYIRIYSIYDIWIYSLLMYRISNILCQQDAVFATSFNHQVAPSKV